ncbi:MAG: sulfatase-like hydrolase/transferase, partial [Bacteroidota bacterium]
FYVISCLWLVTVVYCIYKFRGFYMKYPNDIFLRYHYILVEIFMNLKRSWEHYQISKLKVGQKYQDRRAGITIEPIHQLPNLYFLYVESYGSYFYKNNSGKEVSFEMLRDFEKDLTENGYKCVSAFSESTTIGGQSWLTYSSMLFGYRIDNNTLFENHLNDENFRKSKGLLQLLKSVGYHNYNLNPINPIAGLHVPYEEMRAMYAIDTWFLADDIDYVGDQYGFGQCAPDQYSLNKAMEMIQRDRQSPYTLFYLTKNSHSPFISPPFVANWKDLNKSGEKQLHVHKGFLKNPRFEDYQNAIKYEFDTISQFIEDYGKQEDIFIVVGDHQPPILANKEQHGLTTPVHIISRNDKFLLEFHKYGFTKSLIEAKDPTIKHEAFYSIFLNAFANQFTSNPKNIPEYEPEGIKL